jgi:ATP-dependent RNA helicase DeaD
MQLPSVEAVNDKRIAKFKQRIGEALTRGDDLALFRQMVEQYETEQNVPAIEIAAALAKLVQGDAPFLLRAPERRERFERTEERAPAPSSRRRPESPASSHAERMPHSSPRRDGGEKPRREPAHEPRSKRERAPRGEPEAGFETFRIEVGHDHGVKPGNIVGAIANEAGLDAKHIGRVDIRDDHSFVDLPDGMPSDVFKHLKKVWVSGQQLRITRGGEDAEPRAAHRPSRAPPGKPPSGFGSPKRPKPAKRR